MFNRNPVLWGCFLSYIECMQTIPQNISPEVDVRDKRHLESPVSPPHMWQTWLWSPSSHAASQLEAEAKPYLSRGWWGVYFFLLISMYWDLERYVIVTNVCWAYTTCQTCFQFYTNLVMSSWPLPLRRGLLLLALCKWRYLTDKL